MKTRYNLIVLLFLVSKLFGSSPCPNNGTLEKPLVSHGEGPNFLIDYSNFQGVNNQTYIEFYIQVSYYELQFIKHKGCFQAGYNIEFSILDEKDNLIEHYSIMDIFEVDTYKQTQELEKARAMLLAFSITQGSYQLIVIITDQETQHSSKIEKRLYSKPFLLEKLSISDIQFSQKITAAKEGQPYVKNHRYIEPNAGRTFTHGISEGLYIYFEIYNLEYYSSNDNSTYTCFYTFYNAKGAQISQFKYTNIKPGLTSAHSSKVPLEYFTDGIYQLTVRVHDDSSQQTSEVSKSFTVLDSNISLSKNNSDRLVY